MGVFKNGLSTNPPISPALESASSAPPPSNRGVIKQGPGRDDDIAFVQRHYYDVAVTTPDYVYAPGASRLR